MTKPIAWLLFRRSASSLAGTLAVGLIIFAGCSSGPNDKLEGTVNIESAPANATVKIDGAEIGRTPMKALLSKMRPTHIIISKQGFVAEDLYVRPRDGDLQPNPVSVALKPELLPQTRGADPQAEYARGMEVLKQYLAMGRIQPEDQAYIEKQLRAFYGIQTPAK